MWAKYKFYVLGAVTLVVAIILYNKYGKKASSAVEKEVSNPGSKLTNTGLNTVGDQVALMRAANFVK